ncbi:unnamed protein product, partial [Ectocarpus fasciculatus]
SPPKVCSLLAKSSEVAERGRTVEKTALTVIVSARFPQVHNPALLFADRQQLVVFRPWPPFLEPYAELLFLFVVDVWPLDPHCSRLFICDPRGLLYCGLPGTRLMLPSIDGSRSAPQVSPPAHTWPLRVHTCLTVGREGKSPLVVFHMQ